MDGGISLWIVQPFQLMLSFCLYFRSHCSFALKRAPEHGGLVPESSPVFLITRLIYLSSNNLYSNAWDFPYNIQDSRCRMLVLPYVFIDRMQPPVLWAGSDFALWIMWANSSWLAEIWKCASSMRSSTLAGVETTTNRLWKELIHDHDSLLLLIMDLKPCSYQISQYRSIRHNAPLKTK